MPDILASALGNFGPLEQFVAAVLGAFAKFFSRFHWVPLASALALAAACWLMQRREAPAKGLLGFIFPRSVWLHRSALLDYRFVLFDKLAIGMLAGIGGWLLAGSGATAAIGKSVSEEVMSVPLAIVAAYTLTLLIVEDFARYWAHRFTHTVPLLWQFHKVHHSPEVLVPFSQMRSHPVNGLVNLIRSALSIGVVTGLFLLIFPGKLTALTIFGVNAGRFVFDLMGSNLRHSHIWLSFGPKLSHIFISPAQHQVHHSKAPEHIDKNFGSQFAIWDWMFGTLYIPRRREQLTLGIDSDSTERMRTIKGLYIEPFKDAARLIRRSAARKRRASPTGDRRDRSRSWPRLAGS